MADIDRVRFVSARDFLNNILPVEQSQLQAIHAAVTHRNHGLYVDRHWSGFPRGKYKEENLYKPFVNIANAIARVAKDKVPRTEDQVREASWKDYHSNPPQSLEPDATYIRPDCTLTMAMLSDADLKRSSLPAAKKETLWWLQFVAVVEAKRNFDQNDLELVQQLLGYLRVVMVEQKDRRFVLGICLSASQASVWLQDRSGVTAMADPIDIHKNSMDFVHMIAAMSVLPAHRLGFDPDMRLAREPSPPIHTYRLSSTGSDKFDVELYKDSHYATQWVINTKSGAFITLRAMSLLRTDQWWKSEDQADEGAIYERLSAQGAASHDSDAQYLGQLECHEVVKIGGEVDSTDGLIQRATKDSPPPPKHKSDKTRKKRVRAADPELDERLHVNLVTGDDLRGVASYARGPGARGLQHRTRVRVVLKTFGCPIKYFTTLRELLTCLLHAVRGHRFAYIHGYVQRDVSAGNLLIAMLRRDSFTQTQSPGIRGCLIDFDHAKEVQPVENRKAELPPCEELDLYTSFRQDNRELVKHITREVIKRALQVIKFKAPEADDDELRFNAKKYIKAALHYYEISGRTIPTDAYTPEQLGWNVDLLHPPKDIGRDPTRPRHPRSGTPPYASAKILNVEAVQVQRWRTSLLPSHVIHDAIHDMESCFWVLLYLCMTRSGPGGVRREELVSELDAVPAEIEELRTIVYCFFDGSLERIARNKKQAFEDYKSFEPLVLRHIHPYFEPLRPLLRRWWELLLLAYEFEGYEYHNIHALVIELLERALKELGTEDLSDDQQHQQDAKRKRDDFFRRVIYADIGIPIPQAQCASAPSSPNDYRVTTAFSSTPESQKVGQGRGGSAGDTPSSPPSPTPVTKKPKQMAK
ncbi:hypothetical protein PYCCODRAFT_1357249 [Trametes coccinea BRFM310]|uniref:Fungal-type protein kinase domain-containing protein n=1 Tax=Trametes coccinea (strain BRFM310) TaxID=1353009 RepID=A0A1Y2J609_TRAC3|nr:hypothetical protein PYCCODRAFT_1357249 [Trametes coccinea BRFM310]